MSMNPIWFSIYALLCLLIPSAIIISVGWSIHRRVWHDLSRKAMLLCVLPTLLIILSYYAFCLHLKLVLGTLPSMINEGSYPAGLRLHAEWAVTIWLYFSFAMLLLWPCAIYASLLVRRWRPALARLGLLGVSFYSFILLDLVRVLPPAHFTRWLLD